jgi:hypothetical protein
MMAAIHDLGETAPNPVQRSRQVCIIIGEYIAALRKQLSEYSFRNEADEIVFFKVIKPQFISEYHYYRRLFELESLKPLGTDEQVVNYFKTALDEGNAFVDRYQVFVSYVRSGRTDRDTVYFLRSQPVTDYMPENIDGDPDFDVPYSNLLSKLQAHERIAEYCTHQIRQLEYPRQEDTDLAKVSIPWTDTKAGLIELLYGIQCLGSLNNAKVELRQIARLFEAAFNVELGNYSRAFQEIRIRKKGRTAFIDRMKEMLLKRMDEADAF